MFDKFNNYIFDFEGARSIYFFYHKLLIERHIYNKNKVSFSNLFLCGDFKLNTVKWFYFYKDKDFFNYFLNLAIKDNSYIKKWKKEINLHKKKSIKTLPAKKKKYSQHELIKFISIFGVNFTEFIYFSSTIRFIDKAILSLIRENYPNVNIDEFISITSIGNSNQQSSLQKEKIALLEAAIQLKNGNNNIQSKEAKDYIENIYNNFCWVTRGYYDEQARTRDDYQNILLEYLEGNPMETLRSLRKSIEENFQKRIDFVSKLDPELNNIARIINEAAYAKDYYKFSVNEFIHSADYLFELVSAELGISIEVVKDLSVEEIIDLLKGKEVDFAYVEERKKHNIIFNDYNRLQILIGEEAVAFENKFLQRKDKEVKLEGRIACKGVVKGKAKVILNKDDFEKFQEGNVLVTFNTSPDYVPIMKKASAILAEEGGLTSHTAIVARELNIPTIIGIDNITDTLKDNDVVEVDADNGVVKIIQEVHE